MVQKNSNHFFSLILLLILYISFSKSSKNTERKFFDQNLELQNEIKTNPNNNILLELKDNKDNNNSKSKEIKTDTENSKNNSPTNKNKLKDQKNSKRLTSNNTKNNKDKDQENHKNSYNDHNPKNINPKFNAPNFASARKIKCSKENCQYPNQCLEDNSTCKCSTEYAEFELNKKLQTGEKRIIPTVDYVYCAYRRKSQLLYFLLEFILNIGVGHLYAGNLGIGISKMTLVFLPCVVFSLLICLGVMSSSKIADMAVYGYCLVFSAICAITLWWLVDIILIAIGYYSDGNGVPLQSW